jgi:hypothetical protein
LPPAGRVDGWFAVVGRFDWPGAPEVGRFAAVGVDRFDGVAERFEVDGRLVEPERAGLDRFTFPLDREGVERAERLDLPPRRA